MASNVKTIRAIDRLKKAANLEPTKKEIELSDGTVFEMWITPLTMAEIDVLKNEVRDSDLQALMLAIVAEEEEPIDPKD